MKTTKIGIDVGSTTVKIVASQENSIFYKSYEKHFSKVREQVIHMLEVFLSKYDISKAIVGISGSGGMNISDEFKLPFIQEVIACISSIKKYIPQTDVALEIGGEDSKIIYLKDPLEQRMNSACAGGTSAFIEQMSKLLNLDSLELNNLAKNYQTLYPIASRCGVFAKTDIQPLINQGIKKEDISASIFQAVANQTISGLAQGRAIKGKVAFLGGAFYFLSELKNRFIETLNLSKDQVIFPSDSHYYVALGILENLQDCKPINLNLLLKKLKSNSFKKNNFNSSEALFLNEYDFKNFKDRHSLSSVKKSDLSKHEGICFLGIDAGSTTTKIALIDENGYLLHTDYQSNKGDPINSVKKMLENLYSKMNSSSKIGFSMSTGYGEELIKAAFNLDSSQVETVAHFTAAKYFKNNVDFIIDIGGQDMKCMKIEDNALDSITLNEACSSGCGSFIESFSKTLNLPIEKFVKLAISSKNPVDLGSRCTVFMNSKVREFQNEGVSIEDIAAGICISVIKNALFKVIQMKSTEDLGKNIVVQGGTFYNDAVLRAFEKITNKDVIRPDISGIMGAFGCALLAKEKALSTSKNASTIIKNFSNFSFNSKNERCKGCNNHCLLTINEFKNNKIFVSGNKCENHSFSSNFNKKEPLPNLFKYKYKRLFSYKPLQKEKSRGTIGIPRVLNMYEDYPLWFTLFTKLGFRVELSKKSNFEIHKLGIEHIPSESVCFPAKIVHGHIEYLLKKDVDFIFYPCISYNYKDFNHAKNSYNCPVVSSYPEVIYAHMPKDERYKLINPYLPINSQNALFKRLLDVFKQKNIQISKKELKNSIKFAFKEFENYKKDLKKEGKNVLDWSQKNNKPAIILACRPYHIDPFINHGIDQLVNDLGFAVLTEDSLYEHRKYSDLKLNVVNQWTYHSRLYNAALFAASYSNLNLVQLDSFGCGLDGVTCDEVKDILKENNKLYTVIKMDEINNLGAVKIRLRSLIAAIEKQKFDKKDFFVKHNEIKSLEFTKDMKKTHTILVPQMAPIHFSLLESVFSLHKYKLEILKNYGDDDIKEGLKYVNNDMCYPCLIVIGQIIKALKSNKYDLEKTSVLMSQTGGGCRASNYIHILRKALKSSGFENIPVISFNTVGLEKNSGFKLSPSLIEKSIRSLFYSDLLMNLSNKVRPYEKNLGESNDLVDKWIKKLKLSLSYKYNVKNFEDDVIKIISDFENIEILELNKPKVGIVGEILVKFHPLANNFLIDILEKEGAEVKVPDLMGFIYYTLFGNISNHKLLGGSIFKRISSQTLIAWMNRYKKIVDRCIDKSKFLASDSIYELSKKSSPFISIGNKMGEGWLLTAEMIELLNQGINNILCIQPFACLPNHVSGKGILSLIKEVYNRANIVALDYDPGISKVNQINRIKLMLSIAQDSINVDRKILKEQKDITSGKLNLNNIPCSSVDISNS